MENKLLTNALVEKKIIENIVIPRRRCRPWVACVRNENAIKMKKRMRWKNKKIPQIKIACQRTWMIAKVLYTKTFIYIRQGYTFL